MSTDPHLHPPTREADRLIFAGLLGIAATAIIQLTDRDGLTTAQGVAVHAFAVAMPLLAVGLVTDYARRAGTRVAPWRDGIGLFGALAAMVGFGGLFFHFGPVPGALFLGFGFAGLLLIRRLE
jgi:hypothetical protein